MLHAPVTDRKNKAESTNSPTLAEHEQQSQTVNWSGRFSFMPDRPSSATIQQAYGNQTTLRMLESQKSPVVDSLQRGVLQRKCACGNAASAAGSCTECQEKQERSLQTKLRISEPGDEYEREADRVADQVMQMPEQSSQTSIETTIQPVAQLQRVSWPWPGNGYVINNSGEPVTVWVGDPAPNGRIYTIPAGSSSGRFTEDIDHIRDRWGHWYKIGANTVTVDANGDVTGYACRVRTYGDDCDSSEMPNAELDAGVSHDAGVPLPGGVLDRKISHVTNSVNNADRPNEAPPIVREALNSPGQDRKSVV